MEKKKDLMYRAMEDFWASDYNIPKHKLNTPRIKTAEDDNWDAFWGRGAYTPAPKIPSPTVRYQMPVRQATPNYRPQIQPRQLEGSEGLTAAQQYNLIKQRNALRAKIIQAQLKQQGRNQTANRNAGRFIGGLIKGASERVGAKAKYYMASPSEKLKREKKALDTRLENLKARNDLKNIRTASSNLSKARLNEKIYNARQNIKVVTTAFKGSK